MLQRQLTTQKTKFMKKIVVFLTTIFFGFSFSANSADIYKIDPTHASINWTANHFGFSNQTGKFTDVTGNIILDEANPKESSVDVKIGTASLVTGLDKFDQHLKSSDFLDVSQFPTATFKSTSIIPSGKTIAKVVGDLTMLGIKKSIILDVKRVKTGLNPINQRQTVGFYASTTIRRSDFKMTFGAPGVSDKVKITIELEANFVSRDSSQTSSSSSKSVPEWKIIPEKSSLEFKAVRNGSEIRGSFKKFDGRIAFDKKQLNKSSVNIDIDTTSVETSYAEALSALRAATWLSTSAFPKANFTANNITILSDINLSNAANVNLNSDLENAIVNDMSNVESVDGGDVNLQKLKGLRTPNTFRANGTLTIKGKSVPTRIDFSLTKYTPTNVVVVGKATINRNSFNIGDRSSGVKDEVVINFTISAEK